MEHSKTRMQTVRVTRPGFYYGLTLCEWRGSVQALLRSGWFLFHNSSAVTRSEQIHAAVIGSATMLLPLDWHKAHAGRLHPDYYRHRASFLAMWRPLPKKAP